MWPLLLLVAFKISPISAAFLHSKSSTHDRFKHGSSSASYRSSYYRQNTVFRQSTSLDIGSDEPFSSSMPFSASFISTQTALPTAILSISITYLTLLLIYDRPRGFLSPQIDSTLSIALSRVPNAGLGLFATTFLPCGTILGSYPGVLRSQNEFYSVKCAMYSKAVYYSWRLGSDGRYVIDPTDDKGEIGSYCYGGSDALSSFVFATLLRFCAKSTALARINEPPIGYGGCNVVAREELEHNRVIFELCRDVERGEELFMDYGLGYDRSGYIS